MALHGPNFCNAEKKSTEFRKFQPLIRHHAWSSVRPWPCLSKKRRKLVFICPSAKSAAKFLVNILVNIFVHKNTASDQHSSEKSSIWKSGEFTRKCASVHFLFGFSSFFNHYWGLFQLVIYQEFQPWCLRHSVFFWTFTILCDRGL